MTLGTYACSTLSMYILMHYALCVSRTFVLFAALHLGRRLHGRVHLSTLSKKKAGGGGGI